MESHASSAVPRSVWLLDRIDSVLLVVDLQEKLVPLIPEVSRKLWNVERLIDAAQLMQVPVIASEQYPQGLGKTVEPLRSKLSQIDEKLAFSCGGCASLIERLEQSGRSKVILVGIETHICVLQTALDLTARGFDIFVVADAVGARGVLDHEIGLRRVEQCGGTLVTTESVMFEWCRVAGTSEFKAISAIVRRTAPTEAT